ncbi:4-phosphoerythronate dehydrogenase [Legionella longbeachae]|uniref:Putative erythronate-4-phosphate dehydrogenase n=1 Tax=Legionella longbeachae serogroup 1 (strain NSW150) TaxID=661367 RepID=D3HQN5_LEGLN|nr:4-phosphoerythronate dehydrogenase [Legionella longbeachae]VEE01721.1 erythronate-4-phosphate dehydrogenase [Legionella oakridgensis]ARB91945.1 4-phosphoerythronate dehydrogenase [Legionella longbeachae]ARM34871.1 4-phosphoerythronate dehydrogenase [Legionella longbeachae]EEZ95681.1 erythronate-4-phosphate dehydrogenase [Legionella longbeachae D-4968]QEY50818.1 4-phosphoerythronate dehydrogenase [Legionella longbeachae]
MNILADATLPGLEQAFPKPFNLIRYNHANELAHLLVGQDVLLCRSTLKVNRALLENHSIRYVATASSGTDHLDHAWLNSKQIQIIDAKGSNARAVADYVVACLAFLEQHHFIQGYNAGVIGLGKVGTQVSTRLQAAGFQVLHYDPLKAMRETNIFQSCSLEDLYQTDLICIHAELHDNQPFPSRQLINQNFLNKLKPGAIIINAARGGIVDENALLNDPKALIYCTDVYLNEPTIDNRIIEKAVLCTPHIAGHSIEAKYAAVAMVSASLHQIAKLPIPQFFTPQMIKTIHVKKNKLWYESVLSLYNPIEETLNLKKAADIKSAFIELRKHHQNRHDFCQYSMESLGDEKTKLLLGM